MFGALLLMDGHTLLAQKDDKTVELASSYVWTAEEITTSDNKNKTLNIITRSINESQFALIACCIQPK